MVIDYLKLSVAPKMIPIACTVLQKSLCGLDRTSAVSLSDRENACDLLFRPHESEYCLAA